MATKKKAAKKAAEKVEAPSFDRDNTVFIIDGSGYIFRAYYAIRRLNASDGRATNAVFGFTTMLLKVIKEHDPKWLAIAFDKGGETFRHRLYPEYKANRPPPPEDLPPQKLLINDVVDAFHICRLDKEGWEADDLIATVAERALKKGKKVVIITGDKDFMQLVSDDLWLLDEMRQRRGKTTTVVKEEQVREKFGVGPEHVVDVLALAGDSSDNIPGVYSIGEKTAATLVNEYGDLEKVLAAAPTLKQQKRKERLISEADNARLSKELVTISKEADTDADVDDMVYSGPDKTELRRLFSEFEFRRLLNDPIVRLTGEDGPEHKTAEEKLEEDAAQAVEADIDTSSYKEITTLDDLNELADLLKQADRIAVQVEAERAGELVGDLTGLGLSWDEGAAAYIPLGHDRSVIGDQLNLDEVQDALEDILLDPKRTIVGHNAKDAVTALEAAGFGRVDVAGDPMVGHYLLDQEDRGHGLMELSRTYLGHVMQDDEQLLGKGKSRVSAATLAVDTAASFVGEKVDVARRVSGIIEERLEGRKMLGLYRELEMPVERVLSRMERNGVMIDTARLAKMSVEFEDDLKGIEEKAYQEAGDKFLISSPQQVAEILFEKLKLPVLKRTKTGPSTDSSVLEQLESKHPLPRIILDHRQLAKLKNTYIDVLPKLIHEKTGRVHTTFNQAVAATGRLSSQEPNLQNIPIRTEVGRRIREAFIAPKGSVLASLDYSQIELRILAHVTEDPVLIDTFEKDVDVHARTAAEIFDCDVTDVNREQRTAAKAINFGLLYGMGVLRLAREIGVKRSEAKAYLDKYWSRFGGVRAWNNDALEKAHEIGEVRTLFGRRRLLPELASENRGLVARAERLAINTPIQGSAADLIKKAMVTAHDALEKEVPSAKLLLQVHDELVLECPEDDVQVACDIVREAMVSAFEFKVPLKVDFAWGRSWAEAH
jgi:DNA polymerase-1